jgi:hypothetical protein
MAVVVAVTMAVVALIGGFGDGHKDRMMLVTAVVGSKENENISFVSPINGQVE